LFLCLLLLYLSLLSKSYLVDGLNFAKVVEDADPHAFYFFHPHHLLYAPICYLLYWSARMLGYSGRAVTVLQVFSSIMGALGVAVFFSFLRRLNIRHLIALISSLFLAFSYGYWYHSVNVSSTLPALALLMISLYLLVGLKRSVFSTSLISICQGLCILFHQIHVLSVVPFLAFFLISGRKRSIAHYFLGLISCVAVPYLTVGTIVLRLKSIGEFLHWTTQYLHSEPSYWEVKISILLTAVRSMGISLLGGHYLLLSDYRRVLFVAAATLVSVFITFSLFRLLMHWKELRRASSSPVLLLSVVYAGVFSFWCPGYYSFWVIQLVPLFSLLSFLWNEQRQRAQMVLVAVLVIHFGLNLFGNVVPKHLATPGYVEFLYRVRDRTARDDLFIIRGLTRAKGRWVEYIDPNILYSLKRDYVTLPDMARNPEQAMGEIERRVMGGLGVYLWWDLEASALEDPTLPHKDVLVRVLSRYDRAPAFSSHGYTVWKLTPTKRKEDLPK